MENAVNWFELPVLRLERAQRFYETVLDTKLKAETLGGVPMAIFPYSEGVGGALIQDARYRPSPDGAIVYLDAGGALEAALQRVEAAGGRIAVPMTPIGPAGFMAIVTDTEGNRVGLHQKR